MCSFERFIMGFLLLFLLMPAGIEIQEGGSVILSDVQEITLEQWGCFNAQGEDTSPVILEVCEKKLSLFAFNADKSGGAHDWRLFPDFTAACEVCITLGCSYRYKRDLEWSETWN